MQEKKRKGRQKINLASNGVHPLVRLIDEEITAREMRIAEISKVSGVSYLTMYLWRTGRQYPSIASLEAVLGALGYDLKAVKRETQRMEAAE